MAQALPLTTHQLIIQQLNEHNIPQALLAESRAQPSDAGSFDAAQAAFIAIFVNDVYNKTQSGVDLSNNRVADVHLESYRNAINEFAQNLLNQQQNPAQQLQMQLILGGFLSSAYILCHVIYDNGVPPEQATARRDELQRRAAGQQGIARAPSPAELALLQRIIASLHATALAHQQAAQQSVATTTNQLTNDIITYLQTECSDQNADKTDEEIASDVQQLILQRIPVLAQQPRNHCTIHSLIFPVLTNVVRQLDSAIERQNWLNTRRHSLYAARHQCAAIICSHGIGPNLTAAIAEAREHHAAEIKLNAYMAMFLKTLQLAYQNDGGNNNNHTARQIAIKAYGHLMQALDQLPQDDQEVVMRDIIPVIIDNARQCMQTVADNLAGVSRAGSGPDGQNGVLNNMVMNPAILIPAATHLVNHLRTNLVDRVDGAPRQNRQQQRRNQRGIVPPLLPSHQQQRQRQQNQPQQQRQNQQQRQGNGGIIPPPLPSQQQQQRQQNQPQQQRQNQQQRQQQHQPQRQQSKDSKSPWLIPAIVALLIIAAGIGIFFAVRSSNNKGKQLDSTIAKAANKLAV